MEKTDFKKGDVVTLKSGGPVMTVESFANGLFTCHYFNYVTGEFKKAFWPPEFLRAYTGPLHVVPQ